VDQTIRHCLEKNPQERFQSAHDLGFQLRMTAEGLFAKPELGLAKAPSPRRRWVLPLILALMLVTASLTLLFSRVSAKRELPVYKRLTFRSGSVGTARFANDGRTIIYGAAWEGNPSEIFVSRVDSTEARPLGIGPSELLSISKNGELAVLTKPQFNPVQAIGTLATVPLEGGAPREIAEDVTSADWAPDGSGLVIVRNGDRLEFPIGKVLFQSTGWLSHPRFSPDGKYIAFIDHPPSTNAGSLVTCDLDGKAKVIATGFVSSSSAGGVAWSPQGKDVWFSAVRGPGAVAIWAISRTGKERIVARGTGWMTIHDIAPDGRVLFSSDDFRVGIKSLGPHATEEHDLSWSDWSLMGAISEDGTLIAFSESGEAVGQKSFVYVRGVQGTPAIRLGEGRAWSISPDKKWVIATAGDALPLSAQLVLLPTGSGDLKRYPPLKHEIAYPKFLGDGKRIIFGVEDVDTTRINTMTLDTGEMKPALPDGVIGLVTSPDGKYVVARSTSDPVRKIYQLAGGPPRPIKGLKPGERVIAWGRGNSPQLYVAAHDGSAVMNLFRLNPVTGQRQFWRRLMPSDPAGVRLVEDLYIAPDAEAYGYSYYRLLSQLYTAEGLR
jgi:Tol biopolymer transport system component